MPWRGPSVPGEFPTLGYLVADWIEEHVVIPDGDHAGEPYLLTDEMVRFLLRFYRLHPVDQRFFYRGAQLMRSQKWGKGPFAGVAGIAEAIGPVLPDGWDANGEPVGRPWPSALVQVTAVSEDQADNVYRALLDSIRLGPLADVLDHGETRINLPGGGRIEPVTSSSRSRLGQRLTFAIQDETHLWTGSTGMITLSNNQRRGAAGMGGRWLETTNAYDPAERSVAQTTMEGAAQDVLLDHRTTVAHVSLTNKAELSRALRRVYGDSWWVPLDRIQAEIADPGTLESDARRYFLSEIVAGADSFVDATAWDAAARDDEPLAPRTPVTLGFDGSKTDDATSLIGCRISDGRLFHIATWEKPAALDPGVVWRVPSDDVDRVLSSAFEAYRVFYLFADPWKWQDYLDRWSARWPKKVVEFPTNVETRMDKAIERFQTAFRRGEITHDGDPTIRRHVVAAVVAKGKRKTDRDNAGTPGFYMKLAKKVRTGKIDGAVAATLAWEARGQAIEDGALRKRIDPLNTVW